MQVRAAPLIGATAAYGLCLAVRADAGDDAIEAACRELLATRPTAINLSWALDDLSAVLANTPRERRVAAAYRRAAEICDVDVATCRAIGGHGLPLIEAIARERGGNGPVNVLTHCNAGWLATVDWGTALAPIYLAWDAGIAVHVWVDETRPRNQGAALVDLCLTGTDRTTARGDVCNKIGTYLQALAAHDNGVPFYVALPHATIDWEIDDGIAEIPIEEREPEEVTRVRGESDSGEVITVRIAPEESAAANYAFDVTPARLVTGLITERGVCAASREGLLSLYPEKRIG